jgi:hypothetical protein
MDNDEQRYAQMKAELDAEDGIAPAPTAPPEGDQYDPGEHGVPQPPEPQPQPQQHEPAAVADINEAPLEHFHQRTTALEQHALRQAQIDQGRNVLDLVERSEARAREETYGDYDEAVQFLEKAHRQRIAQMIPDGPHSDTLAHQYGLQNAEHLRQAIFERDRQSVIHQALTHNTDPARLYYQHAVQYGYASKVALTKSQQKHLLELAEEGGEKFDKAWAAYAKAERRAEQNRRSRR